MTAFKPGQSPPPVRIPIRLATHAEGGNRTHTGLAAHRILSPARLPVPPLRLGSKSIGALPQTLSGSARPRSCRAAQTVVGRQGGGPAGEPWVHPRCPHGPRGPPDFESGASASSATSAWLQEYRRVAPDLVGLGKTALLPSGTNRRGSTRRGARGGTMGSPALHTRPSRATGIRAPRSHELRP